MSDGNRDLRRAAAQINSGIIHLLRGVRRVDRASGLTPARLSALSVLVFGGPRTLGRLAVDEDVAGPTMTRIVDGLCGLGLAERTVHPDSARSVRVVATPVGERLMRRAAGRRIDLLADALARLDPAERDAVLRAAPVLEVLADRVWQRDPPSPRR